MDRRHRPQSAFFFCCLCFTLVNFRLSLAAVDEQQILLAFKQQLVDSSNVLGNWNDSTPLCRWKGVTCDSAAKSVTGIDFSNFDLNGTISSSICELPNLTSLIFLWNNFRQSFPFWIARCSKLSHVDLGQNFFGGPLPSNFSKLALSSLRHLDLSYNEFTGPVPADFGELSTLERLDLAGNHITILAPELGKLSNLTYLSLMDNIHLIPAPIPRQFGNLSKITYLNLAYCQLIGEIPPELGDLKELDYLQLQSNNLTGSIPVELMFLPKLTKLELYINQLSGEIPQEVGNLVSLTDLDASQNFISGSIPERISELKNLRILHLENLVLFKNKLTGEIPRLLCNGEALENVSLYANSFTGRIPESYGRCRSLLRFQLQDNSFEGPIPPSLWASPKMTLLDISSNKFNGSVPNTIGGASQLHNLILPNLVAFTASSNRFSDSYPFGSCTLLENLNMSENQLSGVISADVGNCLKLNSLDLSANKLSGSIPSALGSLPSINALDLSDNQLSGFIPSSLGKPLLSMLNVSNNNLQGSLPGNWKNDFPSESFQGNPRLCVDRCPSATSSKDRDHLPVGLIAAIVIIGTVMLVIVGALSFCWRQHKLMDIPRWKVQSFQRLSFDEMTVVEKMEENNVVGCGRSGKVYRVDRKR